MQDQEINPLIFDENQVLREPLEDPFEDEDRAGYQYNRRKAVQYAERWWNDYNPAYKKFEVDCTNYVSQCLHQGGAQMRGYPNRVNGWWMQK